MRRSLERLEEEERKRWNKNEEKKRNWLKEIQSTILPKRKKGIVSPSKEIFGIWIWTPTNTFWFVFVEIIKFNLFTEIDNNTNFNRINKFDYWNKTSILQ